ncbi:MAG: hypothetical protein PHF00_09265 [Elusimicrobia bacterium]|nr:hypothetical protein [Elusimicrobiota bacterium]
MKKLLGSVASLALVLSFSQVNAAELLKNLKFGGSVEMQATSARNVLDFQTRKKDTGAVAADNGIDRIGDMQTRIMLNMDWDLLDDVHSRVTLRKNNRVWGNASERAVDGAANTGLANNVFIDEGYVKIDKVFNYVDTTFGRQFFGEEGDLVIYFGPKHNLYGMAVTALDAARFDWMGEKAYVTALAGKADGNAAALGVAGVNDQDIRGLVVGSKGIENADGKVYLYNLATHRADSTVGGTGLGDEATKNDNLYVAGLKVKGKLGGLYGSAEFAKNFGTYRAKTLGTDVGGSYSGFAFLVDAGFKADLEQVGMLNPWAQFGLGTGRINQSVGQNEQFTAIATDYRPGAIYGRFSQGANNTLGQNVAGAAAYTNNPAGNGLANRVIYGVGAKATPAMLNKLTAGVSYWDFRFHRLVQNYAAPGVKENAGNKHIGSEIDVDAEWKHSENVSFKGTLGTFQPGGFIKEKQKAGNYPDSPALMAALDLAIKF